MWDSQNRLVSCTVNGATSAYTYGNDGLRRSATTGLGTANAKTTYYVYDGQSMVEERQANAQGQVVPSATYLTGQRGPECRIDETQTESYYDSHYHPQVRGRTSWYVFDGLGSVAGEVDQSGNLTTSAKYDVYGGVRVRSGTATTAHGFVGALGHTSDASTGLIYMKARYYDPNVGRFISEDPKADGINWFIYCNDDPVNNVDITGKSISKIDAVLIFIGTLLVIGGIMIGGVAALIAIPEVATAILDLAGEALAGTALFDIIGAAVTFVEDNIALTILGGVATGMLGEEVKATAELEVFD